MTLRLRTMLRPHFLALAILPSALAACDGGTAPAAAPALGGTYEGSAGNSRYTFVIPDTRATPFGVTGTVTEGGARYAVTGTGVRTGDKVTLELMREPGNLESVFGFSGTIDRAGGQITLTRAGRNVVLRRD